jgi:hypothetical protein
VRRIATWLLVGAVAALGVAAAVDAMRGTERPSRQRAGSVLPGLADQPELAIRQLREAGVRGVLTYSDEACKLHAVSLPDLRPVRAPSYEMCRPAMASRGLGTVDGDVVWAGLGYGTFQVVLSKAELGRQLTRLLSSPGRHPDLGFRAVQAVALDDERTVVLADSTYVPKDRVLVLLHQGRVVRAQPTWLIPGVRFLRPSPTGVYFASMGPDALGWFDRDADPLELPDSVQRPHAVAWSPDERWTALATAKSVYVFPSARPDELIVRIPLAVNDFAWSE